MKKMDRKHWLFHQKIAHRGYHGLKAPENSLAAFKEAIRHGFAIELDLHLLKDGQIIAFHDDDLSRMTSAIGQVAHQTYDEIKELKLLKTKEHIPLLEEVLALVAGQVPLLIELKDSGKVGHLEEKLMEKLAHYKGDYAVQAFNPLRVLWFRYKAPHVLRGQLSGLFEGQNLKPHQQLFMQNMWFRWFNRPDFYSYQVEGLHLNIIKWLRRRGKPIFSWTARNQESYDYAKGLSDNVIFEKIKFK